MGAAMEGQATSVLAVGAHAEGNRTRAPGAAAHAEGLGSAANGPSSHAEGNGSYVTGDSAHGEGINATATGNYSHAGGVYSVASALGQWCRSCLIPSTIAATRAQVSIYTVGCVTTNTLAALLTFDGLTTATVSGPTTNVLVIPQFSTYQFTLSLATRRVGVSTASQGWVYNGLVGRDSGNARIIGSVAANAAFSDSAIATVAFTANTTSQYLSITVTPATVVQMSFSGVLTVNELAVAS